MPPITFSGIASGIDGEAIIKALIDAKKTQNAPFEAKVANAENENKALEEFSTKLLTLSDSVKNFLTLSGSSVSKTGVSSNPDAADVSAGSNALAGTTTFTVQQLATTATTSFADSFSELTTAVAPGLSPPATMQITVGTGATAETVDVTIDSTTTVDQLQAKINAASASGKVRASLVNVGTSGSPQYRLVVSSTRSGVESGSLQINVPSEVTSLGALQIGSSQDAKDAIIDLDGLGTVSRPSNQITDLIPGVTINLKQAGSGPVTVSVTNDADKTAKKLNDVITAFNAVMKYSRENSTIDRVVDANGKPTNKYGTLARTRIDERAVEQLRGSFSSLNSNVEGSAVRVFADLGITTQKDGTLGFDTEKFMQSVAADPVAVDNLVHQFADKVGSANGIVADYTKYQGQLEVATKSNEDQIKGITDRLNQIQDNLDKQTQALRLQFSKLESTIAKLNSSGEALTSLITGAAPK
ncbi:MAG: flagellar filament capping protein FliD [Bdellovibrionota bacterium]